MRSVKKQLAIAFAIFSSVAALAQDVEHGERLVARFCAECHPVGAPTKKTRSVMPLDAIAAKPGVSAEVIANFLMLPHATMPDLPIKKRDAEDIAAFIMQMKR